MSLTKDGDPEKHKYEACFGLVICWHNSRGQALHGRPTEGGKQAMAGAFHTWGILVITGKSKLKGNNRHQSMFEETEV